MENPHRPVIPFDEALPLARAERKTAAQLEALITLSYTEEQINRLVERFPTVNFIAFPARKVEEVPPEVWARIQILYTDQVLPNPELVPQLRWLQFNSAGIDFALNHPLLKKPDLAVTSLSGAAAAQAAEYSLAAMLSLGHHFVDLHSVQLKSEWPARRWERFQPVELRGSTVAIIGYGSIGRELARLLQPFGCEILAVKHDAMHPEDDGYTAEGLGDPGGNLFTRLYPFQAIKSVLKAADFAVVTVPLTEESRGMIGAEELAGMKPRAFLVICGRGGVVSEVALGNALAENRLGGAVVDVFEEEPLPAGSPLWKAPHLLLTPHIAGLSALYDQRALDLFTANLTRYQQGEPLFNLYSPAKGY